MTLHPIPLNFLMYEEFFFLSVRQLKKASASSYAIWKVYCLNREKFAIGVKTTPCYFKPADAAKICARISRTFFKRVSTRVYRKNLSEVRIS